MNRIYRAEALCVALLIVGSVLALPSDSRPTPDLVSGVAAVALFLSALLAALIHRARLKAAR